MKDSSDQDWLLAGQVSLLLHVSTKTVTRWAKEGKLPHARTLGGHRRFSGPAIRQLAAGLSSGTENLTVDEILRRSAPDDQGGTTRP